MLPACFEIENPRIGNDREYAWIKINQHQLTPIFAMTKLHFLHQQVPKLNISTTWLEWSLREDLILEL